MAVSKCVSSGGQHVITLKLPAFRDLGSEVVSDTLSIGPVPWKLIVEKSTVQDNNCLYVSLQCDGFLNKSDWTIPANATFTIYRFNDNRSISSLRLDHVFTKTDNRTKFRVPILRGSSVDYLTDHANITIMVSIRPGIKATQYSGPPRPIGRPRKRPSPDTSSGDSLLVPNQSKIKAEDESCSDTEEEVEVYYEKDNAEVRQLKSCLKEKEQEIKALKKIIEDNLNRHTIATGILESKLQQSERTCDEALKRVGLLLVNFPESHLKFKSNCNFANDVN